MADNYRWERIERLMSELRYEITRGIMEKEIDERLRADYMLCPSSEGGTIVMRLDVRPESAFYSPDPHLKAVK